MTSELAKKIQERIYNIANDRQGEWGEAHASIVRAVSFWFSDGKFDDLLAPEGRPVLSDTCIAYLLDMCSEHVTEGEWSTLSLASYLEREGRSPDISAELRDWEAYAEKRKVAG